jgi:hypothetical protein
LRPILAGSQNVFYLTAHPYFCKYRNMSPASTKKSTEQVAKYADMLSATGTEPRLRIMHLPDLHRVRTKSLLEECGWKGGDGGDSAGEKTCPTKKQKNPLDSDRPSHGRHLCQQSWDGDRGRAVTIVAFTVVSNCRRECGQSIPRRQTLTAVFCRAVFLQPVHV